MTDILINQIHTSCKNCLFAIYMNLTQEGCIFNRLHEDLHEEIVEAYDEEKEFFVINKSLCLHKRTQKWGDKYPEDKWDEQIEKELVLSYHIIIFANENLDELKVTTESLYQQKLPPKHITVVNKHIRPSYLTQYLNIRPIPWKVQNVVDPSLSRLAIIDMIVRFQKQPYYSVIPCNTKLPNNLFKLISCGIFYNNLKFAALLDDMWLHPILIPKIIHKTLGGNFEQSLIDKIRDKYGDDTIRTININKIHPHSESLI